MSVKIPADFMAARSARYEDMMRLTEWRAFAYRMKEQANFACDLCKQGGPGVELNVHHHAYDADRLPWEYERNDVAVLCKACHGQMHKGLQAFRRYVFKHLTPQSFPVLNGALACGLVHYDALKLCHAVANLIASPGAVKRFAEDFTRGSE